MISYPYIRQSTTCPICARNKPEGAVTCGSDYCTHLEPLVPAFLAAAEAYLARPITTREIVRVA